MYTVVFLIRLIGILRLVGGKLTRGKLHMCLHTESGEYRRFPDVTDVAESDYEYFISELNFDAIDSKIITGAA